MTTTLTQEGGSFERFNDPIGNKLITLNRDGTINARGITFGDGTTQTSAVSMYGITLPNAKFISCFMNVAATGDTDIYTVPANRRALYVTGLVLNNSGGSSNIYPEVKISGTYYRLKTLTSVSNSAQGTLPAVAPYVAEAGESISINTSAQPINAWLGVLEFDNTAALATSKLTTLATGDNTVYTVTTGKSGLLGLTNLGLFGAFSNAAAPIGYYNGSGGTRTVINYAVPSGGSKGTTNQYVASHSVGSAAVEAQTGPSFLNSGDFIVINVDAGTATQFAWVTHIEY